MLIFDKPEKAMPVEEWKNISADGAPPGVYVPNMSEEDSKKFKAKFVGGERPRIEVRVTRGAQILIKVCRDSLAAKLDELYAAKEYTAWQKLRRGAYEHGSKHIKISMNGPAEFTYAEWIEFRDAVDEAIGLRNEKFV